MLTPADDKYHLKKHGYKVPFVCGARDLGEALRRIAEGAAMIRSKGEAGVGKHRRGRAPHARDPRRDRACLSVMPKEELVARARDLGAPLELVARWREAKKLPVVLFCAGGVSTPADAALMMQLGAEGIFVGSGIFKSTDPKAFARAIVDATTHGRTPTSCSRRTSRSPREPRRCAGLRHPHDWPNRNCFDAAVTNELAAPTVGVLALQGDVVEHVARAGAAGARAVEVKRPTVNSPGRRA